MWDGVSDLGKIEKKNGGAGEIRKKNLFPFATISIKKLNHPYINLINPILSII